MYAMIDQISYSTTANEKKKKSSNVLSARHMAVMYLYIFAKFE